MNIGLMGKKIGMTREFFDSGISVPVTVLSIHKGRILDIITKEKRGYNAIQVGFGKIKTSKLTNQMKGFFAKKSTEPKKFLREFRVDNISDYKEGYEIGLELFKDQKFVDITFQDLELHTEYLYLTVRMAQQDKIKIQEKFLRERRWPDIWVINLEPCRTLR